MKLTFDIKGWTQEQVNMTHTSLRQILEKQGIKAGAIECHDGVCSIEDAPEDFTCTSEDILAQYAEDDAARKVVEEDEKARGITV